MARGIFYSAGVGPGDPELLTFKAVKAIADSDVIVAPKSGGKENIALKIAQAHLGGKEILECDMPMTKVAEVLKLNHQKAIAKIKELLEAGKTVAFLTLGDPAIYSTAMYVHKGLTQLGYETILVPGIPSFCGVAAGLNTSLCEGNQLLHIVPASYENVEDILALKGNKVLMKAGSTIGDLKNKLLADTSHQAMLVECATMAEEKVYQDLGEIKEEPGYFSIILLKEN